MNWKELFSGVMGMGKRKGKESREVGGVWDGGGWRRRSEASCGRVSTLVRGREKDHKVGGGVGANLVRLPVVIN